LSEVLPLIPLRLPITPNPRKKTCIINTYFNKNKKKH